MNKKRRTQPGLSLMEEVVVVATIALLIVFGVPAIRALFKSLESEVGAKAMISGALSTARAVAAKEQRYVGIRFQYSCYKDDPVNSPLKTSQYMIFIIHDFDKTKLSNGFRAVEGLQPIKLPDSVGVMDLIVVNRTGFRPNVQCIDNQINSNNEIDEPIELTDTTSFSIIFSPSGKMVIHRVEISNRDGFRQPTSPNNSRDDIFNSPVNITANNIGTFVQDDYFSGSLPDLGLGPELSRNSFIIYDRTIFEKLNPNSRYTDYLQDFVTNNKEIHINPYTGTMIEK
jgi:hypothetical protein